MTSMSFSTAVQLGNVDRLMARYLSWIITHINRALPQIECLQCAEKKTEPLSNLLNQVERIAYDALNDWFTVQRLMHDEHYNFAHTTTDRWKNLALLE
ncbi:hypothetical protein L195_g042825 [Trifolium pratense]|uniref:Uncharacterized protein n=1 Tax=Trifolium pratense TaxID=57577 RepID=A0A2K3M7I1_TRIPR|nr:hypothetical protein L195_g042825 [Trifolium pratense]